MKRFLLHLTLAAILFSSPTIAQNKKSADSKKKEAEAADKKDPWKTETFNGLTFRCISTAKTSGRVVDSTYM